ncbi:MAG: hypothetical protein WCS10_07515 [Bacteroidales bacterium]
MTKLRLSMLLLLCILGTSFVPAYADNDLKATSTTNETTLSEDINSLAPRKRRKSKKRGGRRGGGSDLAFQKGTFAIDLGVGYPLLASGYEMDIPPVFVGLEYGVWSGTSWAFGLGLYGGYTSSLQDPFAAFGGMGGSEAPDIKFKNTNLLIGVKGTLHYNFSSNFELYTSLIIGYRNVTSDAIGKDAEGFTADGFPGLSLAISGVFPSGVVGIKYYFTNNIGLFLEGGYGVTLVGGGLSLKF